MWKRWAVSFFTGAARSLCAVSNVKRLVRCKEWVREREKRTHARTHAPIHPRHSRGSAQERARDFNWVSSSVDRRVVRSSFAPLDTFLFPSREGRLISNGTSRHSSDNQSCGDFRSAPQRERTQKGFLISFIPPQEGNWTCSLGAEHERCRRFFAF